MGTPRGRQTVRRARGQKARERVSADGVSATYGPGPWAGRAGSGQDDDTVVEEDVDAI